VKKKGAGAAGGRNEETYSNKTASPFDKLRINEQKAVFPFTIFDLQFAI
jgi:hypothetical protein